MIDTVYDIFSRAGHILTIIFLLSCWAWYLAVKKFLWLREQEAGEAALLEKKSQTSGAAKDCFFLKLTEDLAAAKNTSSGELIAMERSLLLQKTAQKNLATINTCTTLAPLLGLLGTVAGMIKTFTIIQLFGGANPALMADGISEALLTTQGGLIVAFPLVIAHSWLKGRADRLCKVFSFYCIKMRGEHVQAYSQKK